MSGASEFADGVTLGTVKELRTMQAVQQAADSYRLCANREADVPQVTMAEELYGGLSLEAKRCASERLVQYVKQAAQVESMQLEKLTPVLGNLR